ncbi:MAG: glycosyltransferase family 2 protein [Mycobacteriaceae bacterium]
MSSVGVVVPCYRYGHLLRQSVGSVLDQPGVDVRVLIIDDASPDDSAERARELAAEDPRVEVRVHPENRGHIATYNEGLLAWCDTDYAVLLSADDMVTPGALTRAASFLDAHPGAGMVYGRYVRFDGGSTLPAVRTGRPDWRLHDGQQWLRRRFEQANGCIASPEVMVRTAVQREVGGYDPALPHTGDIEMWMRFAAHADVGHLGGVDQAYYRVHGANMSATYLRDAGIGDLRQRWAAYESTLDKVGDRIEARKELEGIVRRQLARDALWRACRAYDHGRTQAEPVAELVAFALSTCDEATHLKEYRGLVARRWIGTNVMPSLRPLVLSAAWRRFRRELWWRRWARTGG